MKQWTSENDKNGDKISENLCCNESDIRVTTPKLPIMLIPITP